MFFVGKICGFNFPAKASIFTVAKIIGKLNLFSKFIIYTTHQSRRDVRIVENVLADRTQNLEEVALIKFSHTLHC